MRSQDRGATEAEDEGISWRVALARGGTSRGRGDRLPYSTRAACRRSTHKTITRHSLHALHIAFCHGKAAVVTTLLDLGANVKGKDREGEMPLHDASQSGHLEVVRLLLEHGTDSRAHNRKGETPFGMALRKNYSEVAQVLGKHAGEVQSYLRTATKTRPEPRASNQRSTNSLARKGGHCPAPTRLCQQSSRPGVRRWEVDGADK